MSKQKIRIGTRGSDLALWQANHVKTQLEKLGCEVEITIIKTQGDQIQNIGFDKMEGKGFFTKEIEAALLNKEVDLAIHSHKDLETAPTPGLLIAAVSEREDPADFILVDKAAVDESQIFSIKKGARIGTSSARRKAQLKAFRPDTEVVDLRGNVPTRIDRLRQKNYDAILLAGAGLNRLQLNLSEFKVVQLDPKEFVPAPAQGVLGLQIRDHDTPTLKIVEQLNHPDIAQIIEFERTVLRKFQGGCQLPLGVYCENKNNTFHVWGALGNPDGTLSRANFSTQNLAEAAQEMVNRLKKKILS